MGAFSINGGINFKLNYYFLMTAEIWKWEVDFHSWESSILEFVKWDWLESASDAQILLLANKLGMLLGCRIESDLDPS